jgi:peptidoglycan/LPS O-acetylase OafA/YrhL
MATQLKITEPILSYVCLWSAFFYLGFILRDVCISKTAAIFSFGLYLVHIPAFCILNSNQEFLSGYWRVFSVFGIIMMFYFFQNRHGLVAHFIEWCGKGSLELYLIHAPVLSVMRIFMFKLAIVSLFPQLVIQIVCGSMLGMLFIWLSNKFVIIQAVFKPLQVIKWHSKFVHRS